MEQAYDQDPFGRGDRPVAGHGDVGDWLREQGAELPTAEDAAARDHENTAAYNAVISRPKQPRLHPDNFDPSTPQAPPD